MADDDTVQTVPITGTPRSMRPRASPNAEINAQRRDQVLRDMGKGYPMPEVANVPLRGYKSGGAIPFAQGGPVLPRSGIQGSKLRRR